MSVSPGRPDPQPAAASPMNSATLSRQPVVLVPACNRMLGQHPFHVAGQKYVDAVRLAGCLPLVVPSASPQELAQLLDLADGVLLTGSPSNVHPSHYGEEVYDQTLPLDPVREAALRCVAGSHLWKKDVLPTRWMSETNFYPGEDDYMPVPDPEAEGMRILEWEMEPGDAVAFNFRTLHGARGNTTANRRRAFSLRLVGDDARYVERPGPTSPPFPGHGMVAGQRLREDWFPMLRG